VGSRREKEVPAAGEVGTGTHKNKETDKEEGIVGNKELE